MKINLDIVKKITNLIFVLVIAFLLGWFVSYQIKLNRADREIRDMEIQFNELNNEYEKLHAEIEKELAEEVE